MCALVGYSVLVTIGLLVAIAIGSHAGTICHPMEVDGNSGSVKMRELMVSIPQGAGFWCEAQNRQAENSDSRKVTKDCDDKEAESVSCRTYRAHFLQSEHYNLYGSDDTLGPLVVSLKYYSNNNSDS